MDTKRLCLVIFMLALLCPHVVTSQNKPPTVTNGAAEMPKLDPKLNIFKEALLGGSLQAATVLLTHEDPNAMNILLEVLGQSENSQARMAVCQSLITAQARGDNVKNVGSFAEPLLGVFATTNTREAQLAAETTLVFPYDQMRPALEKLLGDSSKPVTARITAVRALKLRILEADATIKLLTLVDDSDKQVSAAAVKALESIAVEVGQSPEDREKIKKRIQEQDRESFLQDRLAHEAEQKRRLEDEIRRLTDTYLVLLGKAYKGSDDAGKAQLLVEHLDSSKVPVKLWALEETSLWRKGTTPNFPREQLEPILIRLISDPDRNVRLKTAELLAVMGQLVFARPLLNQFAVESDYEVQTELFVALGWACSSAISSSAPANLTPEVKAVRADTLRLAKSFLSDKEDAERARYGADVIEKLLKRDGLDPNDVNDHLKLLLARYEQEKSKSGGSSLAGGLLGSMAALCSQNSTCRARAGDLFWTPFEKALLDESASIRVTAVEGLSNIDPARALGILRDRYVNDASVKLREKIIDLADAVGDPRDLKWLAEKIGMNSESKPAWLAMSKIFKNSDASTAGLWVEKLGAEDNTKLTEHQKISFLTTAEQKAESENKADMLRDVRIRLVALWRKTNQPDKTEEYLEKLLLTAMTPEQKTEAVVDLLAFYFTLPKTDAIVKLVASVLQTQDLEPEGPVLKTLETHLDKPPAGVDQNVLVAQLAAIRTPQGRGKWDKWLKDLRTRLSKGEQPAEKPKTPGT